MASYDETSPAVRRVNTVVRRIAGSQVSARPPEAPHARNPSAGVLHRSREAILLATAYIAPVPPQAPSELVAHVVEVRPRDRIIDWQLSRTSTRTAEADPGVVQAYQRWRSGFAIDRALGERAFLSAVLDRAELAEHDTSTLRPLRSGTTWLDRASALRVSADLGRLHEQIGDAAGWGLYPADTAAIHASEAERPIRRLVPTDPATILLATPTAGVGVDYGGLLLMLRRTNVLGWRETGEQMLLGTQHGQQPLRASSLSAALLRRVARGATHVELRPVPLILLARPLVQRLAEAAALTAAIGAGMRLHSIDPADARR